MYLLRVLIARAIALGLIAPGDRPCPGPGHPTCSVGGGAGGARVLTSRGDPAIIEKEQLLTFRLEEDTTIQVDSEPSIDP